MKVFAAGVSCAVVVDDDDVDDCAVVILCFSSRGLNIAAPNPRGRRCRYRSS